MYGIKTILVLCDLSENSDSVLEAASVCAERFGAGLLVYHASPNVAGQSIADDLKSDFSARLLKLTSAKELQELDHKVLIASENFPSGSMLRQLLSDADLVITGGGKVHAADQKRGKVLRLVEMCEQPVLIIPSNKNLGLQKHILFGSSYNRLTSDNPLEVVKYWAKAFGSEVRIAHVKTHNGKPNEDHVERSREEGRYFEPDVAFSYKLIRNSDVIDGIRAYIRQKGDNDLLVMIRRKHHIFERIFGKNFTFRMLQNAEIPLLILKEPQLN